MTITKLKYTGEKGFEKSLTKRPFKGTTGDVAFTSAPSFSSQAVIKHAVAKAVIVEAIEIVKATVTCREEHVET